MDFPTPPILHQLHPLPKLPVLNRHPGKFDTPAHEARLSSNTPSLPTRRTTPSPEPGKSSPSKPPYAEAFTPAIMSFPSPSQHCLRALNSELSPHPFPSSPLVPERDRETVPSKLYRSSGRSSRAGYLGTSFWKWEDRKKACRKSRRAFRYLDERDGFALGHA
ncbi:hypothetical protein VNI00_004414 [Paramarasmius palmivorus]|uniref:Uncharacterized protein n=1 Tax=Paramarasmius palmivorus TaxID=297713 RepID=A0AAW0DHN7_9AGAR